MQKGKLFLSQHNDANVCVVGVESIGVGLSASIVADYLGSAFDNEERNMLRVGKMKDFDSGTYIP